MLDTKANTEDVNKVLTDLCKELDLKAPIADLKAALREQQLINAGLCADMSFARWFWRSGKTKSGNKIPWNIQTINSDPDNYIWEKDKVTAVIFAVRRCFGLWLLGCAWREILINLHICRHTSGQLRQVYMK
jgi:hypothetical protein